MKVVYCAGPFRASTAWGIAENVRTAERIGLEVAHAGAMPLIPHANTANFQGEGTDQFWRNGAMELLRRCDAVLLVPGWEQSSGTLAAIEEARRLRLPIARFAYERVSSHRADLDPATHGQYIVLPDGSPCSLALSTWLTSVERSR